MGHKQQYTFFFVRLGNIKSRSPSLTTSLAAFCDTVPVVYFSIPRVQLMCKCYRKHISSLCTSIIKLDVPVEDDAFPRRTHMNPLRTAEGKSKDTNKATTSATATELLHQRVEIKLLSELDARSRARLGRKRRPFPNFWSFALLVDGWKSPTLPTIALVSICGLMPKGLR